MIRAMETASPRSHARTIGVVYLGYFVASILGLILVNRKIAAGVAVNCLSDVLYALVTLLFYRLFRRVNAVVALVATVFSLIGSAIDLVDELHAGVLRLNPLLFFGPFCVLLGLLILRSRFLPHWLGWPLVAAGVGWLAFLIPVVAQHAKVMIFPLGFLAEFALMLRLLAKGVDEERWQTTY